MSANPIPDREMITASYDAVYSEAASRFTGGNLERAALKAHAAGLDAIITQHLEPVMRERDEAIRRLDELSREITGLRNSYWTERKEHLAALSQVEAMRKALERIRKSDTFLDEFGSHRGYAARVADEALADLASSTPERPISSEVDFVPKSRDCNVNGPISSAEESSVEALNATIRQLAANLNRALDDKAAAEAQRDDAARSRFAAIALEDLPAGEWQQIAAERLFRAMLAETEIEALRKDRDEARTMLRDALAARNVALNAESAAEAQVADLRMRLTGACSLLMSAATYPTWPGAQEFVTRTRAYLAAPAEARAVYPEWRPIDTLPREWCPLGDGSDGTWWSDWCLFGRFRDGYFSTWVGLLNADQWLGRQDDGCCFDTEEPTHWLPHPTPPKA